MEIAQPYNFIDWGLIDYQEAQKRQLELVEKRAAGEIPDTIVFCTHPPVVTLGRSTQDEDFDGWQGPTVETSRGGRLTYHGPSQMVIYPIFLLKDHDVHKYLRWLENLVVHTLRRLGIDAEARTVPVHGDNGEKLLVTGVWIAGRKVASVGVAVKRWVTYHGVAINLDHDPKAFAGIRPCGFRREIMISIEEVLGMRISRDQFMLEVKNVLRVPLWRSRESDLLVEGRA